MSEQTISAVKRTRVRSNDRIVVLKPIDGKPLNSAGLLEPRLFTGENRLHIKKAEQGSLWSLSYDFGVVPPSFKQRFTSYEQAYKFVENYFRRRNIEITKVID